MQSGYINIWNYGESGRFLEGLFFGGSIASNGMGFFFFSLFFGGVFFNFFFLISTYHLLFPSRRSTSSGFEQLQPQVPARQLTPTVFDGDFLFKL